MKRFSSLKLVPVVLAGVTLASSAHARLVQPSEIRDFASKFSCRDPKLKWQFDRMTSIWDENERMRANAPIKKAIVTQASDVRDPGGDILYRGVTNAQFNEAQILAVIFNDAVAVSESRWFSGKMLEEASLKGTNFVALRDQFRAVEPKLRETAFHKAFEDVRAKIEDLLGKPGAGAGENGFSEHVRVGSSFNGTPQAIQFLTPHRAYAEAYGEYVLHVKEVVKRGLDVERYNFHNRNWNYSIGSIYVRDQDEYMVPSHIPSWDAQAVKVRDGTGWLRGSYGPALYFYTKVYEDKNPCNVIGVRVDRADASDQDDRRVPVGMLLRCPRKDGSGCKSDWDHAIAHEARLKTAVETVRIDDHPIYYVPYSVFQSGNPEIVRTWTVSMLANYHDQLKDSIKGDADVFRAVLLDGFSSDYDATLKLLEISPTTIKLAPEIGQRFKDMVAKSGFEVPADEFKSFVLLGHKLGVLEPAKVSKVALKLIDVPGERSRVLAELIDLSNQIASLKPVVASAKEKMLGLADLKPSQEVLIRLADAQGQFVPALIDSVAKALSKEAGFPEQYTSVMSGTDAFKTGVLERAILHAGAHSKEYPIGDTLGLWIRMAPSLANVTGRENVLGACIDLALSQPSMPAWQIANQVGRIELPGDRAVDTIRAIWGYAKSELMDGSSHSGVAPTNLFQMMAVTYRNAMRLPLVAASEKKGDADAVKRTQFIKDSFNQFFWEFVSPPSPMLGSAALMALFRVSYQTELLIYPTDDKVQDYVIDGVTYSAAAAHIRAALGQSMSVYAFQQISGAISHATKDAEKDKLMKSARDIMKAYTHFAVSGGLEQDLKDEFLSRLFNERYKISPGENTIAFLGFLAEVYPSDASALKAVANRLEKAYPAMAKEVPNWKPEQALMDFMHQASGAPSKAKLPAAGK